jgi:hypothetical protein
VDVVHNEGKIDGYDVSPPASLQELSVDDRLSEALSKMSLLDSPMSDPDSIEHRTDDILS